MFTSMTTTEQYIVLALFIAALSGILAIGAYIADNFMEW